MKIRERDSNVGLGAPSMILIVMVTAMSVFALLGLRSAQSERKLAMKTAESVKNYYAMEAGAEDILAEIDRVVAGDERNWEKLGMIRKTPGVTDVESRKDDAGYMIYVVKMVVTKDPEGDAGIEAVAEFHENSGRIDIKKWKYYKEEPKGGYLMMLPDGSAE